MIYKSVGGIRDPLKQDLALEFSRTRKRRHQYFNWNSNQPWSNTQLNTYKKYWLGPIFFSPRDNNTKGFLALLHPRLEGITEVDTDPKWVLNPLCYFTPFNDRVLCVYVPSGHSTREQLAMGRFFEELQNYMETKNERNENKIILGDFNCTMDKVDRYGGNKTRRLYRCCSNYALIVDNGLEDLWRRQNPDSSELIRYDRSFGKDPG